MTNFQKGDLKLNYFWTASRENDNAGITGFPDNILLDRNEGYEVLPFLNRYMTAKGWVNKSILHRLEDALRNALPGSIRSHEKILKWLNENFTL